MVTTGLGATTAAVKSSSAVDELLNGRIRGRTPSWLRSAVKKTLDYVGKFDRDWVWKMGKPSGCLISWLARHDLVSRSKLAGTVRIAGKPIFVARCNYGEPTGPDQAEKLIRFLNIGNEIETLIGRETAGCWRVAVWPNSEAFRPVTESIDSAIYSTRE